MASEFIPNLAILPAAQQRLWPELVQTPELFTLWGGTALALHLGHRKSVDFDFFADEKVDLNRLRAETPYLRAAIVIEQEPGTLTCTVDRGGPIKLQFFVVPGVLRPLQPALRSPDNNIKVASLIDLAAMKVKVVQDRAETKDYIDVDAILQSTKITLADALSAATHVYGDRFQVLPSLKALSYFADGNLKSLPEPVKRRLAEAVRRVDPLRLPSLVRIESQNKASDEDRSQ